MKMRASAVAGVAGHGDPGALCNHITNLDEQGAVVRIQGLNAVAVIEDDVVAIAVRPFGYDHLAVVGCIYCGTDVGRKVDPFVPVVAAVFKARGIAVGGQRKHQLAGANADVAGTDRNDRVGRARKHCAADNGARGLHAVDRNHFGLNFGFAVCAV